METRRKFLIRPCSPKKFFELNNINYSKQYIIQYCIFDANNQQILYQKFVDSYLKTIIISSVEHSTPIAQMEFDENLKHSNKDVICKVHYTFSYEGRDYALDKFQKNLKGLYFLEFNFKAHETLRSLGLPMIFRSLSLAEVTFDKRFDYISLCHIGLVPSLQTGFQQLSRKIELFLPHNNKEFPIQITPFETTETAILATFRNRVRGATIARETLMHSIEHKDSLHLFWYELRKIHALLSVFSPLLAKDWTNLHIHNITMLMSQTDKKRELDIFINALESYHERLSSDYKDELFLFEEYLQKANLETIAKVAGLCNSELVDYEFEVLLKPHSAEGIQQVLLKRPIIITSMEILQNRVKKILHEGSKFNFSINSNSPNELRSEIKRLCSLIENTIPLITNSTYSETLAYIRNLESLLSAYGSYEFQKNFIINNFFKLDDNSKFIKELFHIILRLQEKKKITFYKEFMRLKNEEKHLKQLYHF